MSKVEQALVKFNNDFNCAQAVFSVYSEDYGLSSELACKTACALGAGMGRTGRVCGAVTGALMAIGLARGMGKADETERKAQTYQMTQSFIKEFGKRHKSIDCRDILGVDISTADGLKEVKERGLIKTVCAPCVRSAVDIVGNILENHEGRNL
jgi:C_GCAxxG_C_C family probable redox protein